MLPKQIGKIHWWFKEKGLLLFKKVVLFNNNLKIRYYEKRYYKEFGVKLNIKKPITFYDKINYLKFFSYTKEMSIYTDKIKAKDIANSFNGNCKIAKLLKTFTSFREFVEWCCLLDKLNTECVVKTNSGSGAVFFVTKDNNNKKIIIRDKHGNQCDKEYMIKSVKHSIHTNWYYQEFEKNYKSIKPKIYVEEYFATMKNSGLNEYKFFCNFGEIKLINVVYNRQDDYNLKEVFTDGDLNPFDTRQGRQIIEKRDIVRPQCFGEMVEFASSFSKDFPFLRVDLLCDDNHYYFCEFTFYDFGGFSCFYPIEWNKKIGDMFKI